MSQNNEQNVAASVPGYGGMVECCEEYSDSFKGKIKHVGDYQQDTHITRKFQIGSDFDRAPPEVRNAILHLMGSKKTHRFLRMKGLKERMTPQALFSVKHEVDLTPHIEQLMEALKGILPEENVRVDRVIETVALLTIIYKNLDDKITCGLAVAALAAAYGLASTFINMVVNLLQRSYSRFCASRNMVAQLDEGELDAYLTNYDVVGGLSYLGGVAFLCMIGMIVGKLPGKNSVDEVMSRIRHLPNTVRSGSDIIGFGQRMCRIVFSGFTKHVMGWSLESFDEYAKVNEWMEEVREMTTQESLDKIKTYPEVQARADDLYARGLKMQALFDQLRMPREKTEAFRSHLFAASQIRMVAQNSGAGHMVPRVEPIVVQIFGASGAGKSVMLNALNADILKAKGYTDPNAIANEVYSRKVGQDFFDGYPPNCIIVNYDDFAAVKDNEMKPNQEFLEIIYAGNIQPYNLHMASLHEKANTFMKAHVIILTSNRDSYAMDSLSYPDAQKRRMHIRAHMTVKDEYGYKVKEDGKLVTRLDKSRVEMTPERFMDAYKFDIVDPLHLDSPPTEWLARDLSYQEFAAYVIREEQLNRTRGVKLIEVLADYMKKPPLDPNLRGDDRKWMRGQLFEDICGKVSHQMWEFVMNMVVDDQIDYDLLVACLTEQGGAEAVADFHATLNSMTAQIEKIERIKMIPQMDEPCCSKDVRRDNTFEEQREEYLQKHRDKYEEIATIFRKKVRGEELTKFENDAVLVLQREQQRLVDEIVPPFVEEPAIYDQPAGPHILPEHVGVVEPPVGFDAPNEPDANLAHDGLGGYFDNYDPLVGPPVLTELIAYSGRCRVEMGNGLQRYLPHALMQVGRLGQRLFGGHANSRGKTHIRMDEWVNLPVPYIELQGLLQVPQHERYYLDDMFRANCFAVDSSCVMKSVMALRAAQFYGDRENSDEIRARVFNYLSHRGRPFDLPVRCEENCVGYWARLRERLYHSIAVVPFVEAVGLTQNEHLRLAYLDAAPIFSYKTWTMFQGLVSTIVSVLVVGAMWKGLTWLARKMISRTNVRCVVRRNWMSPEAKVLELAASGDVKTKKNEVEKVLELATSGDVKTKKIEVEKVLELATSGDVKTKGPIKLKILETDLRSEKLNRETDEGCLAEMLPQIALDQNGVALMNKVLMQNMYKVSTKDDVGNWHHRVNLTFIGGVIAITVKHARVHFVNKKEIRLTSPSCMDGFVVPTSAIKFYEFPDDDERYGGRDLMFMEFPRSVRQHPDLVRHLATGEDYAAYSQIRSGALIGFMQEIEEPTTIVYTDNDIYPEDCEEDYSTSDVTVKLRTWYCSKLQTTVGDCGMLWIDLEKAHQRKIFAMHCAGTSVQGATAIGTPLNRKLVETAIKNMQLTSHIMAPQMDVVEEGPQARCVEMGAGVYTLEQIEDTIGRNFTPYGKVVEGFRPNTKTSIRRSPLGEAFIENKTKPAHLKKVVLNGILVDPMEKAIKKADVTPVWIDPVDLGRAMLDVARMVNKNKQPRYQRVLTRIEAVKGVDGEMYMPSIKRSTSAGWPWVSKIIKGKGKTTWLGYGEDWKVSPELEEAIDDRIARARAGERSSTLWMDVLKDERRPLDRVDEGKTRLFSVGPLDFNITVRQYFLGFVAHMMENRVEMESCVGVNPFGMDWTMLAKRMRKYGHRVIAGDFSNFDGTLNSEILWSLLDMINEWYGDGPDNARIRRVLFCEIVHSIHLNGSSVYGWNQSQPSGNPLTTILNSLYNSVVCRMVYLTCTEGTEFGSMKAFSQNVNINNYGDDNLWNISSRVQEHLKMEQLKIAFHLIGMKYTDEDKTEGNEYRKLGDVAFLKRGFKFDPEHMRFRAPLKLDVILEMMQWVRGVDDVKQVTADTMEIAMYELAQHDKIVFDEYAPKIREHARLFGIPAVFDTYDGYMIRDMRYESISWF